VPKYKFTALDVENKKVVDVVDARDEGDFRKMMRARGLFPVKFRKVGDKSRSYRLKADECSEFCRQLSGMLSSGITAVRAMEILKDRDYKPKLKIIYDKMYRDIQRGTAMSDAMQKHGNSFPPLLVNMFASGETSGKLENVADRMAVHYDKEHKLNGKIKSAMRYPKILGFATVVVVLVVFMLVLPSFFDTLEGFELPLITRIVIGLSDFLLAYWYMLIIGVVIVYLALRSVFTIYKVRLFLDKIKVTAPVIGKLLRIIYTARFSRTLSSLYSSGVSILSSLEITGTVIMNKYIEAQFPKLIGDVRNGEPLSAAVGGIDGFDKKLASTILIGEESGRLDTMLMSTADSFEYESEQAAAALVSYSEPMMIVVMGIVIMIVLLSVMLPMASFYDNFGV
jgi:type IV pilus assembly protein PilC